MNSKTKNTSKQSNKGLQKFTKLDLSKNYTIEEIKAFGREERLELGDWITSNLKKLINSVEGVSPGRVDKAWDDFERYIEAAYPSNLQETKRSRWQSNRHIIEREVHKYLVSYGRLPTQNELVNGTGLSRVTVAKHLKEGAGAVGYKEETETYRLMTQKVLSKLYRLGMEGNNTEALKIFLDYLKEPQPTSIRQQNNYLQVNNTRIDELILEELPQEAKIEIETVLKRYIKL